MTKKKKRIVNKIILFNSIRDIDLLYYKHLIIIEIWLWMNDMKLNEIIFEN